MLFFDTCIFTLQISPEQLIWFKKRCSGLKSAVIGAACRQVATGVSYVVSSQSGWRQQMTCSYGITGRQQRDSSKRRLQSATVAAVSVSHPSTTSANSFASAARPASLRVIFSCLETSTFRVCCHHCTHTR